MIKIGIDPDTAKSGVAVIIDKKLTVYSLSFFELFEYMKMNSKEIESVVIEASWLISNNFSATKGTVASRLKVANYTGANHQVGRLISEMCNHLGVKYTLLRPLQKVWGKDSKGYNKKISHDQLMSLQAVKRMGFVKKQTNQEERDAVLLVI